MPKVGGGQLNRSVYMLGCRNRFRFTRSRGCDAVLVGFDGRGNWQTLGKCALDLGQQFTAHLFPRRLVVPIQEPAAGRRFAERLVGFKAQSGEILLHLSDSLQALALPTTEAEHTTCLDRPVLNAL